MSQDQGASARADRATRASPEPASGLGQKASVPCAFTPGPWEPKYRGAIGNGAVKMYWLNELLSVCTENDADVRLIAAAPDLYHALTRINDTGDDALDIDWIRRISRAALAKARGQ